ncbi:hypothetical protein [Pedobacter sp. CFBP9032]|uniref:hypothetical protein n=1 Tax=Pedobacter sp. CFBP9032 TaxID=3096539 RepID=UPI002A6B46A2|nr:hypothetical protein [Pedobacter sp. CFBP9032]MDY0905127.1 hypothetical protein [Pedobacter sp. CFBP9032]
MKLKNKTLLTPLIAYLIGTFALAIFLFAFKTKRYRNIAIYIYYSDKIGMAGKVKLNGKDHDQLENLVREVSLNDNRKINIRFLQLKELSSNSEEIYSISLLKGAKLKYPVSGQLKIVVDSEDNVIKTLIK